MWQTAFVPFDKTYINYIKNTEKNDMKVQHYHDSYEIYLQISGERYMFHDHICYNLKHGDLVIIRPFDIHYTESREIDYYERYVLNFHLERLSSFLSKAEINMLFDKLDSNVIHLNEKQASEICSCFKKVDSVSKRDGFLQEKLVSSVIFQLIMMICDFTKTTKSVEHQDIPSEIVTALHYINKHYNENISLETISNVVHMSKYYFCRLFHHATGATFVEYLYNIRLTKVHRILSETDLTLSEIATKTGFSSGSHLSRVFKQVYNMSPREFRKTQGIRINSK